LLRLRNIDQCIPAGGSFPEPRADRDKEIAIANALSQCGINAKAEIPNIQVVPIVEQILAAETCRGRELKIFGKFAEIALRILGPAAAAEQQQRAPGSGKEFPESCYRLRFWRRLNQLARPNISHRTPLG
jgi:hypothetical protein